MSFASGRFARLIAACLLVAIVAIPSQVFAQDHVVSSADLNRSAAATAQTRQQNVESLQKAFANPKIERAMKAANIDPAQVKTAVSSLSDTELAQLTARASHAQQDFAGGTLSDRDLIIILVAIAALILIIVAVR